MRTDIKIGVAVLLILLVLAVLWMVFSSPQQAPKDEVQLPSEIAAPAGTLETDDELDIGPIGVIEEEPTEIPEVGVAKEKDDSLDDVIGGIDDPDTDAIGIPAAPSAPQIAGVDEIKPIEEPTPIEIEEPAEVGVPMELNTPAKDAIPAAPVAVDTYTRPVTPAKDRTHVVKKDETLWIIAEIEYGPGNGKHWEKIKQANPNVDSSNLKVGQLLKIPALVREPSASFTTATTGGLRSSRKTYTVRQGDSLWKIAKRADVYGDGSKWQRIADANPNVNTQRLRPGMKLIIPAIEATTPSVSYGTPATVKPGQSVYIVQEGDSGMWAVAAKKLGNGKYWHAISKVNYGVNPSKLKPGMKLIIPSLAQAKKIIGESSSPVTVSPVRRTPRRSAPPADSGEPVFD